MKKKHEQKLIVLSIILIFLFNIPLVFIFNGDTQILGYPILYFSIFFIWLSGIIISFYILHKYYE